jgi:outer membrane lipase/esterase
MSPRLVRIAAAAALLAAAGAAAHASAPRYPAVYAFGDSLSDSGNGYLLSGGLMPVSPPYAPGRWSNGPTWVEDLAPVLGVPPLKPSTAHGTDFAVAGACTGTTLAHQATDTDLPGQFADFTAAVPQPVAGALYTLDIGSNDMQAVFGASLSPAQSAAAVGQAVTNATAFVGQLFAAGMRTLLLLTVSDQTKEPYSLGAPPLSLELIHATDTAYDTQLVTALKALAAQDGFTLLVLDMFAVSDDLAGDSVRFGVNPTDACYTGRSTVFNGTLCATTRAGQDQYVYWDTIHPTARAHQLIAAAAASLLGASP